MFARRHPEYYREVFVTRSRMGGGLPANDRLWLEPSRRSRGAGLGFFHLGDIYP
jgi:hypothetical protein